MPNKHLLLSILKKIIRFPKNPLMSILSVSNILFILKCFLGIYLRVLSPKNQEATYKKDIFCLLQDIQEHLKYGLKCSLSFFGPHPISQPYTQLFSKYTTSVLIPFLVSLLSVCLEYLHITKLSSSFKPKVTHVSSSFPFLAPWTFLSYLYNKIWNILELASSFPTISILWITRG